MAVMKPNISFEQAVSLVQSLYDLVDIVCLKEFISYDNQNILIEAHQPQRQGNNVYKVKLVLKLTNSEDSLNFFVHKQINEVLLLIKGADIACSWPITNRSGMDLSLEQLSFKNKDTGEEQSGRFLVRLMSFIPGECIGSVAVLTTKMCYEVGQLLGKMSQVLERYQGDMSVFAERYEHYIWSLRAVPRIRDHLHVLTEDSQRKLVEQILDEFDEKVLSKEHKFTKGLIHGDFNDYNVLVRQPQPNSPLTNNEEDVAGVLDFDDSMCAPIIFDLGIAIMYTMQCKNLEHDPIKSGGHVLAGYLSERHLNNDEFEALYYCVAARFAQSLVLGLYSKSLQPQNDYVLSTQVKGWEAVHALWSQKVEDLYCQWKKIANIE